MKYLENCKLDALVSSLTRETTHCFLETKIESYSCKLITREKRLFKAISSESGKGPKDLHALSPSTNFLACSPTSRIRTRSSSDEGEPVMCDVISTKTLFYLTSTLNESFRDFDFTTVESSEFSKENNIGNMMSSVDCRLLLTVGDEYNSIRTQLWNTINDEIFIKDCLVYSYNPETCSGGPYSKCLWSFNYFFYNVKLKRVLFFTCMAKSFSSMEEDENAPEVVEESWLVRDMED